MSKNCYIGINAASRKVKDIYIGVGGVARKVTKGYIGIGGVARQFFEQTPPTPLYQLGKDWWEASVPNTSASSETCTNIAYGSGRFVAFGTPENRTVRYSLDGTKWYDAANGLPQIAVNKITGRLRYLDNTFLLSNTSDSFICRSTDGGVKWSYVTAPARYNDFAFGNSKIVAVGVNGAAYSLDQGKTWTASQNYVSSAGSVAFGNGKFIVLSMGSSSTGGYSADGATWTEFDAIPYCTDMIYAGGKFVAVSGNSKTIYYSNNGMNWFTAINTGKRMKSIAYGDGVYLATLGESSNIIFCSTDAISWEEITLPLKSIWYGVAFGNHTFVLLADSSVKAPQALFSRVRGPASS